MKKNSILFIFSNFNEYDFDIILAYKDLNSKNVNYQSSLNIWSIKTILNIWSIKTIKKIFYKKKSLNISSILNLI